MPKKVVKNSKQKMDFESFMNNLRKDDAFIDLSNRTETFYPFGDYKLDRAIGGGLPAGQIYSFQGPASSGKTLAALNLARTVVNEDKRVFYFDVENKISVMAQRKFGLYENPNFVIFSVGVLEDALDKMMQAIESDLFGLIVIDSVDALTTDEQEERDIHDGSKVGGYKAKVLSEWLGKVSNLAASHECSVCLIRQVRDNVGVMYGNPETTSGGKAIEFYATTILRFGPNKEGNQEQDGKVTYQGAKITVKKMNQGALPKDSIAVRFYIGDEFDWGFDKYGSTFEEAKRLGVLAPPTATSHKYVPCDDLCAALDITDPADITFNGKPAVMSALMNDKTLFNAVADLVEKCDGKPITECIDNGDDAAVDFEEIDEE